MPAIGTTFIDDTTGQMMSIVFVEDRIDQARTSHNNNVGCYQSEDGIMLVDFCTIFAYQLHKMPSVLSRQAIDNSTKLRFFIVSGGKQTLDSFMENAAVLYDYIEPVDFINEMRKYSQAWHLDDMFSDEPFIS